ncbi:MAG: glycosyltransferase, partial [Proteobacteria bacterium]|nr:glycosyltransferase [Pseudomonadota bacterium]
DKLKKTGFDIVHIQTPFVAHYAGIKLSRELQVPRVETYHTHFEECLHHYLPVVPKAITRLATKWFNRKQSNAVDGLIVPTEDIKDVLIEQDIKTPIEVISTGIDEHFFNSGNNDRFRQQNNIDIDRPVLVHIGRIAHEKNIEFLIFTLDLIKKTVPGILLIIAGEGPAKKQLQKLAKKLKLEENVLFVGYLDRQTSLIDCYSSGRVFIFSSKIETQGLVLLEAMAQGIPVVSLSSLGTNSILQAKKGAIIAREDKQDFAEKVIKLLNDSTLHAKMSADAREYAKTWSARNFAKKKVAFYEDIYSNYYAN